MKAVSPWPPGLGATGWCWMPPGACWDRKDELLWRSAADTLYHLCPAGAGGGGAPAAGPVMGAETPLIAESPILNTAAELDAMLHQLNHPSLGV